MYLSKEVLFKAFNFLVGIERNLEGKLRQEKVSGLSYFLATSELLKKYNSKKIALSPSESSIREEFKKSVVDFKELIGTKRYSADLWRKFDNDVAGSVSSNFLTTVVANSKNLTEPKNYPSRSNSSPLLIIDNEIVSLHANFKENLKNYYNFEQIKVPLSIWLAKKLNFSDKEKISDQINNFLESKFSNEVSGLLKISHQEMEDYGINESDVNLYLDMAPGDLSYLIAAEDDFESVEVIDSIFINIISFVSRAGLNFSEELIKRFIAANVTKPFVILTGLSGSGKTKLAEAVAYWLSAQPEHQVCMVAVGADWTNNEPLLGYADAINKGHYCAPASGILQLLDHAQKTPKAPHFLILDEMNLSHVERYFADFLSAMESSKPELALHGQGKLAADADLQIPARQPLPANVFIIGTVNVDETTYMFSPKVLDRANVIEFRVSPKQMSDFLAKPETTVSVKDLAGEGAHYAEAFVARAQRNAALDPKTAIQLQQDLLELFEPLSLVGAEFGYRSAKEIARFVAIHSELSGENWNYKDALDAQVMQKLMPKLHGSARKLSGVLDTLEKFAQEHDLPLTQNKVERMQKRLKDEGFTSFAEN